MKKNDVWKEYKRAIGLRATVQRTQAAFGRTTEDIPEPIIVYFKADHKNRATPEDWIQAYSRILAYIANKKSDVKWEISKPRLLYTDPEKKPLAQTKRIQKALARAEKPEETSEKPDIIKTKAPSKDVSPTIRGLFKAVQPGKPEKEKETEKGERTRTQLMGAPQEKIPTKKPNIEPSKSEPSLMDIIKMRKRQKLGEEISLEFNILEEDI